MPEYCTCGAQLPDNARFCHRCGKPQWESDAVVVPEVVALPPPSTVDHDLLTRVTFSNPIALRTSLLVASFVTAIEIVPLVQLIAPIFGGFAAVWLFRRRTGRSLRTADAAKLAWMTALINALLLTIWMSLNFAVGGSAFFDALREQIRTQASSPTQQQVLQMMNDPLFLGVFVLMAWVFLFVCTSLLFMAGGALGARLTRQQKAL